MNSFELIKNLVHSSKTMGVNIKKIVIVDKTSTSPADYRINFVKDGQEKIHSLSCNKRKELLEEFLKHDLMYGR